MKLIMRASIVTLFSFSTVLVDSGIISRPSPYSVAETVSRLESVLEPKGITIFAKIDHAVEAAQVGLRLCPMPEAIHEDEWYILIVMFIS